MNIWAGIIMGAVGLGIFGLTRLYHAGGKLVTEVHARIFSIDFTKIVLALDIILKNPTNTEITIKYPFLYLAHNGTNLASSDLKDEDIVIPKFGQKTVSNIKIPLNFLQMAGLAPELLKKVRNKKYPVTVQIGATTSVRYAGTVIPYQNVQDVTF